MGDWMTTVARTRFVHGVQVPSFLYGTAWKEDRTGPLTTMALSEGFRAIDTANQRRHYVEAAVGEAVAAAIAEDRFARSELFLQTKFTPVGGQDHRLPYDPGASVATQVAQSFESSLEHLQTPYVDSYLLHGPAALAGLQAVDWEAWRAMEALQRSGRARLIGVSNVTAEQLRTLCQDASVRPAFVQNRCYARTGWDREVRAVCRQEDIAYQAFALLTGNREALATPAIRHIAARLARPVPVVVFRFALQMGMLPLTGSSNAQHLRDDLGCFDVELDTDDLAAIEGVASSSS
jgi:diketogulonate reductase-like aldo/keto reductase